MTNPTPENDTYSDGDGLVSIEDTTLQRDSDGEIIPNRVFVEELGGEVLARPLTRDDHQRFVGELLDGDKEELSDAELAELFDKYVVKPDLGKHGLCEDGRVTERFVSEGINQSQEDGYYIAVLLASGDDDIVRRLRGEYNTTEMELIKERMKEDGVSPQGNRSENETRRDRR